MEGESLDIQKDKLEKLKQLSPKFFKKINLWEKAKSSFYRWYKLCKRKACKSGKADAVWVNDQSGLFTPSLQMEPNWEGESLFDW